LGRLYLLADGAGGHAAGEVASRLAVETIAATYYAPSIPQHQMLFQIPGQIVHFHGPLDDLVAPMQQLQQAFFAAHSRIREVAHLHQGYTGMMTTCITAVVKGSHLLVAHIGDSRAYLIRPSSASGPLSIRLTNDHSLVTELARAGVISVEEMERSPSRHILLRALGEKQGHRIGPDMTTCVLQSGDRLLLCCDGLWSMLPEEQLALVVSSAAPQAACNELIRLANAAGGKDNISAVVLSFAWDSGGK
jgi:protein phosphatase